MDMWFIRMAKWARNPPSMQQVKWGAWILLAAILLFGYNYYFGWPDWLKVNGKPHI
jgi:hypothetical protein